MRDLLKLPENLPEPQDDGACAHLVGMRLPAVSLNSTLDRLVDVAQTSLKPTVFFFYPRTGRPESPAPPGWDMIPGARGCTPQSCGFRDHFGEFAKHGVQIYGVSTQTTEYQQEFARRMNINYEILSDSAFILTEALRLPTFNYGSMRLIKRLAFFARNGKIQKTFYPVFPPDKNADDVLAYLSAKGLLAGY